MPRSDSDDRVRAVVRDCRFCGAAEPPVIPIVVHYDTTRRVGPHQMFRVECDCGAIGKCRPDAVSAAETWNEPWQAKVLPPYRVLP